MKLEPGLSKEEQRLLRLPERFTQTLKEALLELRLFHMINLWNVMVAYLQPARRALYALRVRNTSLRMEM